MAAVLAVSGCGVGARTDFPAALRDSNDNVILFDDVLDVLNNNDLSDEEKRDGLRALGIEDEKLIEALIAA